MEKDNMESSGNNDKSLTVKIGKLAEKLGIENINVATIVKISGTDDPNKKTMELLQGDWAGEAPWLVLDESNNMFVLSSVETFLQLLASLKQSTRENFNLRLEKAILQQLPIDFNDVWVVAMQEIQKRLRESKDKKLLDIDLEQLVGQIKKNYPNLFINFKELGFELRP